MENKKIYMWHQYGVSRCSYGVCTIHLRFHYDSWRQRYDSNWRSYGCSRMLTMRRRCDTVLVRFQPVATRPPPRIEFVMNRVDLDESGCQWYPDSPRTPMNDHEYTYMYGATKNEPSFATVELRFRPRPQSTPNVLKKLKTSNVFPSFIVCSNRNRSAALVRNLFSYNSQFVEKINHSCCALVIWSSLQLTSKLWNITQQITVRAYLFLIFCMWRAKTDVIKPFCLFIQQNFLECRCVRISWSAVA